MSLLTDYTLKQQQIEQLKSELQKLEQDDRLKNEIEFKNRLEALMKDYSKSARDVIATLDPRGEVANREAVKTGKAAGTRRKRKLKVYSNPHNGEVIETRGGNHKQLKEWKEQYGSDVVESWLQS